MRRKIAQFCITAAFFCSFCSFAGTVLNQHSDIVIRTTGPFGSTAPLLEETLAKYTKAKFNKSTLSGIGPKVVIELSCQGETWRDLDLSTLQSIQELDEFIIDTAQPGRIAISARTAKAAGYGLFYFLENYLNIFWLFPGALGECVNAVEKIEIPAEKIAKSPQCISRLYTGLVFRDPKWVKGRYTSGLAHQERTFFWAYDFQKNLKLHHFFHTSHNMINIFPVQESRERFPEIFPVQENGKRFIPSLEGREKGDSGRWQGWHPCYTSEKTVQVATEKAIEYFEKQKGLVFSLGINDGVVERCHCPQCTEMTFPASYYDFVNRVARNVKQYSPPFMVGVLAYGGVHVPPDDLKLEENVLVNCTGSFDKWRDAAENLSVYQYQYGWGYWVPNFTARALVHNARAFNQAGVIGYRAEVHPVWAFDAPKVYILSNLLWDSGLDAEKALEKYCRMGYGSVWEPVKNFYQLWIEHHDSDKVGPDGLLPTWGGGKTFRRSTEQFRAVSPELYPSARTELNKALREAQDETVKKRLAMLDVFLGYSETYYRIFQLRRQIFDYTPDKDWQALQQEVSLLLEKRQSLIEEMKQHPEWFFGTRQTIEEIIEGKMWERRWEWTLDYEGENALRTARYHANADKFTQIPLSFDVLMTPWQKYYHPHIYQNMYAELTKNKVRFHLRPESDWKVDAHSPYAVLSDNGLKKHWFRGNLELEQGEEYLFRLELKGRDGKADIRICNENDCGKQVHLVQTFPNHDKTAVTKQLVLRPTEYWGHTRPVRNWSIVIIFTPNSTKGDLEGNCIVERIEMEQ